MDKYDIIIDFLIFCQGQHVILCSETSTGVLRELTGVEDPRTPLSIVEEFTKNTCKEPQLHLGDFSRTARVRLPQGQAEPPGIYRVFYSTQTVDEHYAVVSLSGVDNGLTYPARLLTHADIQGWTLVSR